MPLPKLSTLEECPHCGCDEFYQKQSVKGFIFPRRRFDGGEADNHHLYEPMGLGKMQKTIYCGGCQKKIAIEG